MNVAPGRPRAIIATPDYPPGIGGIQHLAARLAEGFTALDVEVVTFGGRRERKYDHGRAAHVMRVRRALRSRAVSFALLQAGVVAAGLRGRRVDAVLCAHTFLAPGALAVALSRRAPLITYVYADEVPARPRLAWLALAPAAGVIALSRYTAQLAVAHGARPDRLHLIPPGVDLPERRSLDKCERPTVITVARLQDRYKGHDVMIEALVRVREQVPDVQWVVIGDGPLRSELESRAGHAGVRDIICFAGAVSDEERDRWLDRAHVFAMPSRLPPSGTGGEGFGIAYLEAGAHGIPVVGGDAAGAPDAIDQDVTGLLADPTDPAAIAEALVALLQDRARAAAMGRAGRARAEQHAWPAIVDRVERTLLAIIAERASSAPR